MIDFNWDTSSKLAIVGLLLIALVLAMTTTTGCVTQGKKLVSDALATPTPTPSPLPTPTPSPTPTPKQTPKAIETLAAHYVDPFMPGERWEGQWFMWNRIDVQGLKDLKVGIVAYRHAFMDKYTWWDAEWGNYRVHEPAAGNRYFVVWVHEEVLGNDSSNDPSMWIFDEDAFRVQRGTQTYLPDKSLNPVNRIKELDTKYDYYDMVTAGPFGWDLRYNGQSGSTAGWIAEKRGWLRWGKGNAVDGYLIFEVPKESMEDQISLVGSFSSFGYAYWQFAR